VERMRKKRKMYSLLVGLRSGNKTLGSSKCRWENSIKMYIKGKVWSSESWMDLVRHVDQWRALLNIVSSLRVPLNARNIFE
jgi:hypothetical protein